MRAGQPCQLNIKAAEASELTERGALAVTAFGLLLEQFWAMVGHHLHSLFAVVLELLKMGACTIAKVGFNL